jgi:DNA replication protein DnaC
MSAELTEKIRESAKKLGLIYIHNNIEDEIGRNSTMIKSGEFLSEILEKEVIQRSERSKAARIKNAGFPYKKHLDEIEMGRLPEEAQRRLPELRGLEFIGKGQNIVAYGNPGTGKTHIAIGLGIEAAKAGYSVKYYSVPSLVNRLKELRGAKNLMSMQRQFETVDLMILDELGYITFDREGGELLFTHLSMRTERKSTIITTNATFDKWKEIFGDAILTTAIVDRVTHKSFVLNMVGTTYRQVLK